MTVPMEQIARALADSLCTRLRARGDGLSVEAATAIAGSIKAYAFLVELNIEQRRLIRDLWAHVPSDVRTEIILGMKPESVP